jgi:hypothetical protein
VGRGHFHWPASAIVFTCATRSVVDYIFVDLSIEIVIIEP